LRETHTESSEPSILASDVVDAEGRERDPVVHERCLDGATAGWSLGSSTSSLPSGSSGETT
jgi:hypothetical protein